MEQELDYEKVDLFWEWFEDNERKIRDIMEDDTHKERESLVQTLNNKVLQFGMFSWEMGRGTKRPYFLTISPNRDPELLELSRQIIEQAPEMTYWELNYAKPAQEWDMKLNLFDDDLNEWRVNASSWEFVLLPGPNNKAKVVIKAKNIFKLDDDTQNVAGELVVTGLVGEAFRIRHVSGIEVVDEFTQQQQASATSILDLKPQLEEYLDYPEND